jgi:hypothetical protein
MCETRWFRCTFPVIVSALEYLQTNGDGKPGIYLSVLFAICLFFFLQLMVSSQIVHHVVTITAMLQITPAI